jgi:REP element-mobilizing transposase RayT
MPRRTTDFAPGHTYHIYNRGAGKQKIFREPENYHYLLRSIRRYTKQLDLSPIAYCLMPNHYHLLLRQDGDESAGKLAWLTFNKYAKAFNKRYDRTGTLFEGRYQSIHVDRTDYLLHLCRYIHANPVKAGLVSRPEEWPFSNYLEWVGLRDGVLVDRRFVEETFPRSGDYRQFVADYLEDPATLPENVQPYLLD